MKRALFKPVLSAISLALLSTLSIAQTSNEALRHAAQQAIDSSPDVTAGFNTLRASVQESKVARGGYLPRVDVYGEAGKERNDIYGPSQTFTRTGATLSVNQLLWDGLTTQSEVARLDHARMARYFEFVNDSEQAALEATRAYYDVLRYRRMVALSEDNYVQHKSIHNQIQSRAKAGVGRGVDTEQANARVALAESNLTTDVANLHDVSERYIRIVGEQPAADLPMPALLDSGLLADPTAATTAAINRNTSISAAIENMRSVRDQTKGKEGAFQPKLEARLSTGAGKNYEGNPGERRDDQALLVLNWNLFNGGSDRAAVKQYSALIEQAADLRDKACRDVRQTYTIAHYDIRKLTDQLEALDRNVLSIRKARDAYRQQFDIGQRSLLDLLNSENELYTAERAQADAQYDLGIAYARAQAAAGNLTTVLGLSRPQDVESRAKQDSMLNKVGLDDHERSSAELAQGWSAGSDAAARCPVEALALNAKSRAELDASATGYAVAPAPAPVQTVNEGLAEQRLRDWAAAWMSKDVSRYMTFYSKNFKATTMSSKRWLAERRRLVGKKGPIDVEISHIQSKQTGPDTVETSFNQHYVSDDYRDDVIKTLTWKKEDSGWNIIGESNR